MPIDVIFGPTGLEKHADMVLTAIGIDASEILLQGPGLVTTGTLLLQDLP